MKKVLKEWRWILLALFTICICSCKDDDNVETGAFDPSKPVAISDFTPKEGGAYQKLLIYGENFGTDVSKVKVKIGGKDAIVINVKSTYVYCFVPSGAFSGEIEITVGEGENAVTTTASTTFSYEKKMVVGTLCGYRNNRDDQGWRDGPFDGPEGVKCCGFSDNGRLAFDPLNKDHLYICYDGHKAIQLIDLKNRMLSSPLNINTIPTNRIRSIAFNKKIEGYADEAEYMIVAIDYDGKGDESPSVYIIKRNADGTFDDRSDIQLIAAYKQCNGATIHPINGELYFNSYEKGQVFRLDLVDYFKTIKNGGSWDPIVKNNPNTFKQLFTIADPSWEFQIFIHPTGKYAYFGVINNHYFMRSDYDEIKKEFITPYNFVGGYKQSGYRDDVGTEARMNNPCQGVFVKNPDYTGEEEYDFYFVDRLNFCVRKVTPEGIVSTYAGRGASTSLADGNQWGTDDGDLREVARFRDVSGLVYDDAKEMFYVHDQVGHTITVLKDASATAIYGSKGANGVVLITTKRGKAGKINIDAKVETSYNTRTITPEFVDGLSYASLMNEALVTRNLGMAYQPEELELFRTQMDPDFYPNVDWMDLILKNGAWSYRANLNMNGGGNTARYFVSASYTEDQGMYNTDQTLRDDYDTNANYKKWNYRMNVDIDITKSTLLKLGIAGSLAKRNSPGLADNEMLWGMLFGYNPIATPVYYSNGYAPISHRDNVNKLNPWVASTQTGYNEDWQNNVQTNVTLEQNFDFITKGLKFVGRFGYDTDNSNWINRHRQPDLYKANGRRQETGEIIYEKMFSAYDMTQSSGSSGKRREFLDLLLSWERAFGNHHGGVTFRYTQDSEKRTVDIGTDIKNGVSKRNQGLAGRFTYNWNYRYFVDFNFGYTGSENFAPGNQFGFFPAFSLAWNVAEESFVKNNLKWMNMFKIRYSHGKVGNDNIGDNNRFPYLYTIATTGYNSEGKPNYVYNWGFGDYGKSFIGTHYTQMASNGITWEVATKDDLGIDLSLFNDKFTATVDYFHEKRTGIFLTREFLPDITGLESKPKANVGEVKSQGFDGNFALKQKLGEVDMTIRGNITYSKNEVLEKDEENQVYSYLYQKGYRVDQVKGLIAEGLFADYDDIRTSPKQEFGTVQPGDIKYKDVNGDGVVNDNDKVAIGATTTPNLVYGIGASFAWKGIDVNVHFQGAGKSTFPIYGKCVYAFSESDWGNIFKDMISDRWVDSETAAKLGLHANENPNATYPRLTYGENKNNQQTSTYWMRDGRYIRLKNLDIGYTLPKSIVNKLHFNNIRIYIAGSNLITWSKFKTWDPETGNPRGEAYPLTKSVTMGLSVNL